MFSKEQLANMFNLAYDIETGQFTVRNEDILKLIGGYDIKTLNVKFKGLI